MRDTLNIKDIPGARPKKVEYIPVARRETMKIDDIEGTKAEFRHKPRNRSPQYSVYDYSDITKAQFITKRSTNPLNPKYAARDE